MSVSEANSATIERRDRGEQRQQRDDLDVQPGSRLLAAAGLNQRADLQADQRRHQRHQHAVGDQEGDDDFRDGRIGLSPVRTRNVAMPASTDSTTTLGRGGWSAV